MPPNAHSPILVPLLPELVGALPAPDVVCRLAVDHYQLGFCCASHMTTFIPLHALFNLIGFVFLFVPLRCVFYFIFMPLWTHSCRWWVQLWNLENDDSVTNKITSGQNNSLSLVLMSSTTFLEHWVLRRISLHWLNRTTGSLWKLKSNDAKILFVQLTAKQSFPQA